MKEIFWVIDLIGKLEDIANKTHDLDAEVELRECIEVLDNKLIRNIE